MSSSKAIEEPVVLAMTGASGAVYAGRLLEALLCGKVPVHLTISDSGAAVIRQELGVDVGLDGAGVSAMLEATDTLLQVPGDDPVCGAKALQLADAGLLVNHHYKNYFTPIASGSFQTRAMVICPCSGSTLSGIAHAASNNLIQRAADVHMKEQRKLVLIPRETPLSTLQLENMHRLSQAGAVILPAAPGWYHGVTGLRDLVDFVVARILDQLRVDNNLITRWTDGDNTSSSQNMGQD